MNIDELKNMPFEKLRESYRAFVISQGVSAATVNTSVVDTFYLCRKGKEDLFWKLVTSDDFEAEAKPALLEVLRENSPGNPDKLVNPYTSHLRRFRKFLASDGIAVPTITTTSQPKAQKKTVKMKVDIPTPCPAELESYLQLWASLEDYHLQEDALDKLFHVLCPKNKEITDILIKASTLNDFYSTNIMKIYPVAKHIAELNIDARLKAGDVTLVNDIKKVTIGGKEKNFYSFATKYCSHHNPLDYPIYDSYVDEILRYFRKRDAFATFADGDLKDYVCFKGVLLDFRKFYGLEKYNLKQIDQYLWQLGKKYFNKY